MCRYSSLHPLVRRLYFVDTTFLGQGALVIAQLHEATIPAEMALSFFPTKNP